VGKGNFVPLVEIKPKELSNDERDDLLLALKLKAPDDRFDEFVNLFERALGQYVELRKIYDSKARDSEARSACEELGQAARKLQGAWNKAPMEALQRLNLAYQARRYENLGLPENIGVIYTQSQTSVFSADTSPFFEHLEQSVDLLIKTAELAAASSEKQVKRGRAPNLPLIILARDIATGFIEILDIQPSLPETGAFSTVLRLARQLVNDVSKPPGVTGVVEWIHEELSATHNRSTRTSKETPK